LLALLASPAFAQRLPGGAVPEHYRLWFAPDFTTDTFRGRATIDIRLDKPTRAITLHADWAKITARLGTFQGVPYIVFGTADFCSTEDAADVKSFFASHPVPASGRGIRQSLEQIEGCAAVRARQSAPLSRWLAGQ
jgi:hypothetical protein